jgi:hypothetical protein
MKTATRDKIYSKLAQIALSEFADIVESARAIEEKSTKQLIN